MPRMNDDSAYIKDWTNRKLIDSLRTAVSHSSIDDPIYRKVNVTPLIGEIERRFVRSSSRGS